MKKKLKLKKDAYLVFLILIIVLLSFMGILYAFIHFSFRDEVKSCLHIDYSNGSDIKIENMRPLTIEEGKLSNSFVFTVTNNCKEAKNYNIYLETAKDSGVKEENMMVSLNDLAVKSLSSFPVTTIFKENSNSNHIIYTNSIAVGNSLTYELRLWLNEDVIVENSNNQMYLGKIYVDKIN